MNRLALNALSVGCAFAIVGVCLPAQMLWNNLGVTSAIAHSSAYDAARDRVVAFGVGWTWEFDGLTWSQVFPLQSPPNITLQLGYDSVRQRVVGHGSPAETWEYDGATWARVAQPGLGPQFPNTSLVWHRSRSTLFVLDGTRELWEWNGGAWNLVDPGTALGLEPANSRPLKN